MAGTQPTQHNPDVERSEGSSRRRSSEKQEDEGDSQRSGQNQQLGFWTRNGATFASFKPRIGDNVQLNHTMKPRHLQMIAVGGSIGAGFFVGSGSALTRGGPGFLLIDFLIMGVMIFNVVYALGELAVMYPVSGGFYTYSTRFLSPSWGFAMGWNYVFQWAVVLPLELVVAALTIGFWRQDISVGVWIGVFLAAIIIINVFGTLGYAEEEFWSSWLKVLAIIAFMIFALVMICGGGSSEGIYHEYWGARVWKDPGTFRNGLKGFCSLFVTAAFSFSGTELIGLAAAESENPAKSLPGAVKQVFWRITLFYIIGLLFVGMLVRSDDPRLLGADPNNPSAASPFVIAANDAGVPGYAHFNNAIILVSVVSIGNSGVYGGSRTLAALAEQKYAPKFFAYIDQAGRPLFATIFIILWGFLAFVNLNTTGPLIFDWLLALSGFAALFTWASICLSHIRFRAAWKHHGHTLEEIPFKAAWGVTGSYIALIFIGVVFLTQFYIALYPIGQDKPTAEGFFKSYLAFFVVMVFWVGGYLWKREGFKNLDQIDVDAGRRFIDWDRITEERRRIAQMPGWKRLLKWAF